LRARRLVERNVRFIQVVTGPIEVPGNEQAINWDAHRNLRRTMARMQKWWTNQSPGCLRSEIARALGFDACRMDLGIRPHVLWSKRQWTRSQSWGYTQWLAGGGVKPARRLARPTLLFAIGREEGRYL